MPLLLRLFTLIVLLSLFTHKDNGKCNEASEAKKDPPLM